MNILHMLQSDHRRFLALLDRLDEEVFDSENPHYTRGFTGEAGRAAGVVLAELLPAMARHEGLETDLLFPELVRRAPGAAQLLERMAQEHGGLRGMIDRFLAQLPAEAEQPMGHLVLDLMHLSRSLRSHILREETELYGLAEANIPAPQLERLGVEACRRDAAAREVPYAG